MGVKDAQAAHGELHLAYLDSADTEALWNELHSVPPRVTSEFRHLESGEYGAPSGGVSHTLHALTDAHLSFLRSHPRRLGKTRRESGHPTQRVAPNGVLEFTAALPAAPPSHLAPVPVQVYTGIYQLRPMGWAKDEFGRPMGALCAGFGPRTMRLSAPLDEGSRSEPHLSYLGGEKHGARRYMSANYEMTCPEGTTGPVADADGSGCGVCTDTYSFLKESVPADSIGGFLGGLGFGVPAPSPTLSPATFARTAAVSVAPSLQPAQKVLLLPDYSNKSFPFFSQFLYHSLAEKSPRAYTSLAEATEAAKGLPQAVRGIYKDALSGKFSLRRGSLDGLALALSPADLSVVLGLGSTAPVWRAETSATGASHLVTTAVDRFGREVEWGLAVVSPTTWSSSDPVQADGRFQLATTYSSQVALETLEEAKELATSIWEEAKESAGDIPTQIVPNRLASPMTYTVREGTPNYVVADVAPASGESHGYAPVLAGAKAGTHVAWLRREIAHLPGDDEIVGDIVVDEVEEFVGGLGLAVVDSQGTPVSEGSASEYPFVTGQSYEVVFSDSSPSAWVFNPGGDDRALRTTRMVPIR